jgi:hypothetical protein
VLGAVLGKLNGVEFAAAITPECVQLPSGLRFCNLLELFDGVRRLILGM